MIPLRIRAEAPPGAEPVIVRLGPAAPTNRKGPVSGRIGNGSDAVLTAVHGECVEYMTAVGPLRLCGVDTRDVEGDVLLVVAERNVAHRLIRARSVATVQAGFTLLGELSNARRESHCLNSRTTCCSGPSAFKKPV